MARAKRTERAEARRRYRAAAAADPENETAEDGSPRPAALDLPPAHRRSRPPRRRGADSFSQAFRQSFRPLNVREDLASLPWIAVHTKALWLPLLITFGSTV